jgi:phosphoribosylformylglycinamidine synthase
MKARVTVTLKSGVLDPQGKAIEGALKPLCGVEGHRERPPGQGVSTSNSIRRTAARPRLAEAACEKLLANTVIENYGSRSR